MMAVNEDGEASIETLPPPTFLNTNSYSCHHYVSPQPSRRISIHTASPFSPNLVYPSSFSCRCSTTSVYSNDDNHLLTRQNATITEFILHISLHHNNHDIQHHSSPSIEASPTAVPLSIAHTTCKIL